MSPLAIWHGWTAPTTSGELAKRREAVLLNVLAGMIALSLFTQVIQIAGFNGDAIGYVWWGVNVLVALGSYGLLQLARHGRNRLAATALIIVFELLATMLVLVDGPEHPVWPAVVAVAVLLASILLGARESIITLAASGALFLPLMYLTRAGQPLHISSASADYPSNGGTIGALLGLFGLMATACWLFTRDVLLSIDDALSGSSAASPLRQLRTKSLSLREIEVVQLVAEGKSNDAIARELFVSPRTVHTHVANALRKSGCTNRTELGVLAIREGLAPLSASESDEVS